MSKPTDSQISALIRIRDFEGFRNQFPNGVSARMRDTMQRNGWTTLVPGSGGGYAITDAGLEVLASVSPAKLAKLANHSHGH